MKEKILYKEGYIHDALKNIKIHKDEIKRLNKDLNDLCKELGIYGSGKICKEKMNPFEQCMYDREDDDYDCLCIFCGEPEETK